LSESNAILRYLANRESRDDLYPADPPARARIDMMLDRFSLTIRPAFFQVERLALGFTAAAGFGGEPGDAEAAREKEQEVTPTVRLFDELVDPSGHWLGSFTIADIAAAPMLFRTTKTGMDLEPYPNLRTMRDLLLARPAFAGAGAVT
jgi:glutathione S-transferase